MTGDAFVSSQSQSTTMPAADSRRYRVVHRTEYGYGAPMTDGYTVAMVEPRATDAQVIERASVVLDPEANATESYPDVFGNRVHQFGLHEPHDRVSVIADSVVRLATRQMPVDPTPWESVAGTVASATGRKAIEITSFRAASRFVDPAALLKPLTGLMNKHFTPGRGIVEATASLCTAIYDEFEFDAQFSTVSTPLADVLTARRGVCQDFAHLAVAALRAFGLAARYVSGYIETFPPPGQPRLVGADASHAWCSVWTPLAGWVDFDPTNGQLPINDHITAAWGRDYADVVPVRGVMIGPSTQQTLVVSVDVARQPD